MAQWVTILGFAWLANFGKFETITLTEQMMLAAVIGAEAAGVGLGTAAFVAYMARETESSIYGHSISPLHQPFRCTAYILSNASAGYLIEAIGVYFNFLLAVFCFGHTGHVAAV